MKKLLEAVTDDNIHEEFQTGEPIGEESRAWKLAFNWSLPTTKR